MSDVYDIDMGRVRSFLSQKKAMRDTLLDESFRQATVDFNRMVELVIDKYNPQRIWQWGSLMERGHFSEISDIDMALEGLRSPQEYSDILGDLSSMTEFPVDLVELEKIGVENAKYIRENGRVIYDRSGK